MPAVLSKRRATRFRWRTALMPSSVPSACRRRTRGPELRA